MTGEEQQNKEVLAAEYALGTLDPEERAQARALSASDPAFAGIVRDWERRLGELNVLVAPVEPPAETWDRISARIAGIAPSRRGQPAEPAANEEPPPPEPAVPPLVTMPPVPVFPDPAPEIILLKRSARRWRGVAFTILVLGAAFAGLVALREVRPEHLPIALRPKQKVVEVTKTIEIPSTKPAQFIAVLGKDSLAPAFLLTFDLEKRIAAVRAVAAPMYPGKSYQLWLVSSKFPAPRSLGVIGPEEFTVMPQLAAYDTAIINSGTYSVSLEPQGGSRTGGPTGPMLYSGKLVQTTPIGFHDRTP